MPFPNTKALIKHSIFMLVFNLHEAVGMKLGQLKEVVKDRKLWRKVIIEVTRNRTRIDGT